MFSDESTPDEESPANYLWTDSRGRQYVSDGNEIVPLAKLTAYAEYGDDVLKADHVHHALAASTGDGPPVRVNAPEFLLPLNSGEHQQLHRDESWYFVDGIPLLAPDDSVDGGTMDGHPSEDATATSNQSAERMTTITASD